MTEKLSLNRFLRSCLEENVDFSKIKIRREVKGQHWDKYFPEGKEVNIVYRDNGLFFINKSGWNCAREMGDCEIFSVSLTRRGVVVDIGDGWFR